jgi:hypothetical protein
MRRHAAFDADFLLGHLQQIRQKLRTLGSGKFDGDIEMVGKMRIAHHEFPRSDTYINNC